MDGVREREKVFLSLFASLLFPSALFPRVDSRLSLSKASGETKQIPSARPLLLLLLLLLVSAVEVEKEEENKKGGNVVETISIFSPLFLFFFASFFFPLSLLPSSQRPLRRGLSEAGQLDLARK